jgi:hypothetical protein
MTRNRFMKLAPAYQAYAVASGMLAAFVLYMVFIEARPFFVFPQGWEADYYYSAQAILATGKPESAWHPGTPVYYLGVLILLVVGRDLSSTQLFLHVGYLIILAATIGALGVMARLVLAQQRFGVSMLAFAAVLVWPPLLTFSNRWGADSLLAPATLVTLSLFWSALHRPPTAPRLLIYLGLAIGVTMAVKGAFLPVAVGITLITWWRIWVNRPATIRFRPATAALLAIPVVAVAAFVVMTAPVLPRLYNFIFKSLNVASTGRSILTDPISVLGDAARAAPFFAAIIVPLLGVLTWMAWQVWRRRAAPPVPSGASTIDLRAAWGFLAFATISLLYLLGSVTPRDQWDINDAGIYINRLTPLALTAPLAIAALFSAKAHAVAALRGAKADAILSIGAIALIVGAFVGYGTFRASEYPQQAAANASHTAFVEDLLPEGARAVLGNGTGFFFGEPLFHLSGNNLFAFDHFNETVFAAAPSYALIRQQNYEAAFSPTDSNAVGILSGGLQHAFDDWKQRFSRRRLTDDPVAGGEDGRLALAIFSEPAWRAFTVDEQATMRGLLGAGFEGTREQHVEIDGSPWVLLPASDFDIPLR